MSDSYTPFAPLRYDQQQVSRQGWGIAASGPGDDQLLVAFRREPRINTFKSNQQGIPVYEDKDIIEIRHPGESLNVVIREVLDQDKHRWPRLWEAFCKNHEQVPDGVPLSLLFPPTPEMLFDTRVLPDRETRVGDEPPPPPSDVPSIRASAKFINVPLQQNLKP